MGLISWASVEFESTRHGVNSIVDGIKPLLVRTRMTQPDWARLPTLLIGRKTLSFEIFGHLFASLRQTQRPLFFGEWLLHTHHSLVSLSIQLCGGRQDYSPIHPLKKNSMISWTKRTMLCFVSTGDFVANTNFVLSFSLQGKCMVVLWQKYKNTPTVNLPQSAYMLWRAKIRLICVVWSNIMALTEPVRHSKPTALHHTENVCIKMSTKLRIYIYLLFRSGLKNSSTLCRLVFLKPHTPPCILACITKK